MSYRPICDTWILARSKVKYYGAYPAGFLERARDLLGVSPTDAVLHVCAGRIRDYPYAGLGPNDKTLDLDPACEPDFLRDARERFPVHPEFFGVEWKAVLIDRPYSEEDAEHYAPGKVVLPSANLLLKNALDVIPIGHKVGMLDYVWPQPPTAVTMAAGFPDCIDCRLDYSGVCHRAEHQGGAPVREPRAKEVAVIHVMTGRNNRSRVYTVWRKLR